MQFLEELVRTGSYAQVHEALVGLNEKEQRRASKWIHSYWKEQRDSLARPAYSESAKYWTAFNGGLPTPPQPAIECWMRLCLANAMTAASGKDLAAIPLPQDLKVRRHHYSFSSASLHVLLVALVARGRDLIEEYLTFATAAKKVDRLNLDLAIPLILGFGLPWPQEGVFYQNWAASLKGLSPVRVNLSSGSYLMRIPVLRMNGGGQVLPLELVEAHSYLAAISARPALDILLCELLARRDGILGFYNTYGGSAEIELLVDVLGKLAASGLIQRAPLFDSLLMALTRVDSVNAQRIQARLLEVMADDKGVLRQRAALASVFVGAHGSAASVAQQLLLRSDTAQQLESAQFIELCDVAFARKEKGLRDTQLAWIGNRVGAHPAQSSATLQGLFAALGVEDLAFQKKAVALIQKHWGRADAATKAALNARLEAVRGVLDAGLASTLAAAIGVPAAVAEAPVAALHVAPLQEMHPVTRFTVPPADAATLRELQAALAARPTVFAFEQILCIALELAATDRRALKLGLQSTCSDFPVRCSVALQLAAFQRYETNRPPTRRDLDGSDFGGVVLLARMRYHEIAAAIMRSEPYPLVSRPDYSHGAIEAASLVQRLQHLAAQGKEAPPADFLVALLRTRPAAPDDLAALRAIGSAQAQIAVDFLAAGGTAQLRTAWHRARPEEGIPCKGNWFTHGLFSEQGEICVSLEAMAQPPAVSGAESYLPKGFTPETATDVCQFDHAEGLLTSVLPEHGEALAAMALWAFRKAGHGLDSDGGKAAAMALPVYLAARGPAGPALHLAVLFTLSANDAGARLVGSDGLVELIAQGRYDGALAGELVAACIECGSVKVARLAKSLVPAVDAGAGKVLWPLFVAAAGAALAQATPPAGTPDLLALAHRVAQGLGIREPIAGLAETAARKGSSKLLVEARRLNEWLGG